MNANLTTCRDCGKDISRRASTCPNCGAPNDAGVLERQIQALENRSIEENTERFIKQTDKYSKEFGKAAQGFILFTCIGALGVWASYDFEQWESAAAFFAASAFLGMIGMPAKLRGHAVLSNLAGIACGALWGYTTWLAISNYLDWPEWALWGGTISMGLIALGMIGGEKPPTLDTD
ncbi:zinc ribbon domain-containing protein [Luminiphilus syltensis]|uniref:zinc ribbon domain-containing protein n=1 Tax=Luminiphilus syltensis TaxID=1341119 RepID=UPI00058E2986|nr:zinc ribbon domain-containing protein [Luminiphilus syltensis]